jgi:ribosomal protein S18 acetylase RimI-like enzyme
MDPGRWDQADALERSKKAHESLLPDGIETGDNYLFNIIDNESSNVGHIWVKIEDNIRTESAFVYDIEICESGRRKGYAKSALGRIEEVAADLGATNLGLQVFAGNSAAIALYNSIGYQTVGHNMQKPIGANGNRS